MSFGQKVRYARGDIKITPQFEAWLYTGARDLDEVHRVIGRIIDRPQRVRTNTFSASGAGQCLRRRQLAYLGYEQEEVEPRVMGIFVNGDYVHLKHQVAGIMMGYFLDAEVSVARDEFHLTGTMDAILDDDGVGEIKSINERGFKEVCSFGPKKDHLDQVHSYFVASGRDHARIIYENKNTQELKEFLVKENIAITERVISDLKLLNEATADEVLLPPLPGLIEMKGECRSCPFRRLCADARFESQVRTIRITRSSPDSSSQ